MAKKVTEAADYVPPPKLLSGIIKKTTDETGNLIVSMPAEAFAKLMEAALNAGFNEAAYLASQKDVSAGVVSGTIPTGLRHYAIHGFLEGRAPLSCSVDAEWYLRTYPDVKKAVAAGEVNDAEDHFLLFGYAEGRAPGPAFQRTVADWHRLASSAKKDSGSTAKGKPK